MRVSATFLSLALALGTASAADCYSIGGCGTCNTRVSMYGARDVICSTFWSQAGARLTYGYAVASISGNGFETEQRCYDGFNDIIDSCHGMRNGGVYDWKGAHLDVNFCACGKVAGEADVATEEATANATLPLAAKDA